MGDRLKQYESSFNINLPKRFVKVLRLDGKAFHTLLKNTNKPYDSLVKMSMQMGIKAVMREIGGNDNDDADHKYAQYDIGLSKIVRLCTSNQPY